MTVDLFDELERGHEAKYKLDQEHRFKAQCRASKLLGRWAATRLGLPAPEAEAYAKAMIGVSLGPDGTAAVAALVQEDLTKAGVSVSAADIERAADHCNAEAVASLAAEYPAALGPDHIRVGD